MPIHIVDVSGWEVVGQEPSGADAKEWLAPTESAFGASTSDWWLFKSGKFGTRTAKGGEESQYRRGEDWAEKLAEVCARALGLPCAEIELALWNGDEGVISRNVRPDGTVLYSGDVMLSDFDGYVPCASKRKMKERPGHSLANIQELLRGHSGPMGSGCDERDGFDVFAGYLVLDAWIANTDRHAVNWAVTLDDDAMRLASTFDHGSALASGLEDALRER